MNNNENVSSILLQLVEFNLAKGNIELADDFYKDLIRQDLSYLESYRGFIEFSNKNKNNSVLYAFYDKRVSPTTFDFITFMVLADMERVRKKCNFIHVLFVGYHDDTQVSNESNEFNAVHKSSETVNNDFIRWRLHNILVPCCSFVPSCTGITICASYQEARSIEESISASIYPEDYSVVSPTNRTSFVHMYRAMSKGICISHIRATQQSLVIVSKWIEKNCNDKKIITISLRESPYNHTRNSKIDQWDQFVRILNKSKFCPVLVRDTYAQQLLPHDLAACLVYEIASWNMFIRMALYQSSFINLSVSNGVASLFLFCDLSRYIVFKIASDSPVSTPDAIEKMHGIAYGSQPPMANKFQKFVWEDDDYEVISREFSKLLSELECGA